MKNIPIIFLLVFLFKFTSAQKEDLTGAWYSNDSTQSTSLIFYSNSKILMRTETKNNIHKSTSWKGIFELKNDILIIKLENKDIVQYQIQFLNTNSLQMSSYERTESSRNKEKLIFLKGS